jgi:predicted transport protein
VALSAGEIDAGDGSWITSSCHYSSKVCEPSGKIFGEAMQRKCPGSLPMENMCYTLLDDSTNGGFMSTVDEGLEAQIRNIEQRYGKPLSKWIAIVKESGLTKHTDIVAMLKSQYGMSHGSAHRVALKAREADAASIVKAAEAAGRGPIADLYSGKKAGLKPLHDALMTAITNFGDDIELAPKKGYVSLRRKKQFAMIQPTTTRIDVGLILKEVPTTERLESAANFNALFTHRVRVNTINDVDAQVIAWLKQAYDLAG